MKQLFEKLTSIINNYDNFIIMGHKDPDLDSLGASLGLYEAIEHLKKNAYIFIDTDKLEKYNSNINQAFKKMEKKIICVNEKTYTKIKGKILIIIVDVHVAERLEYKDIISLYDVVVLDHHIKNKNYIKNTKFMYIDSNLSSMSELITFYDEYLNINLDYVIATILLAGIEVDTNSFNLKTTSRTYEAASTLMEMGADSILKQELLKETKEEYMKRANFIRNSFMINNEIAMCIASAVTSPLELAEIAEELLTFEDVCASFALGKFENGNIGVSSKSLGKIDVSFYMKKLGGGGHTSNAACEVTSKTLKEVKQELIEMIKN